MVVLWGTQALFLNVNGGVAFFSYLYLEETVGKKPNLSDSIQKLLMNDQIKLCRPHSKDQEALTKY
jgi:hypothetical protein